METESQNRLRDDVRIKQYELAIQYVLHQDERRWSLLNVFLILQGVLASAAIVGFGPVTPRLTFQLCLVGGIVSVFWYLATMRSEAYLTHRVKIARRLQDELKIPEDERFWGTKGVTEDAMSSAMGATGLVSGIQVGAGICWAVAGLRLALPDGQWAFTAPENWAYGVALAILCGLIAWQFIHWFKEFNARRHETFAGDETQASAAKSDAKP